MAFFITNRQREQAERMAEKWKARAEAFFSESNEGWGFGVAGYCKTLEQAEKAEKMAERIEEAISALMNGCGTWDDVKVIQTAVSERDGLDSGVIMASALMQGRA